MVVQVMVETGVVEGLSLVCRGGELCCGVGGCGVGQGDCGEDRHCSGLLVCGEDNCSPSSTLLWDPTDDCCRERCSSTTQCTQGIHDTAP